MFTSVPGFEVKNHVNANLLLLKHHYFKFPLHKSAKLIKEGKSIRYMVPEKVREEIEKGGYYKK